MLKKALNLLEGNNDDETGLWNGAIRGQLEEVKKHATASTINSYDKTFKRTALYRASGRGHLEVVKYLLSWPQLKINFSTKSGATPFMVACQEGQVKVVRLLMAHPQCDINLADKNQITPFSMACRYGHAEIIQELMDDPRVNLDHPDHQGLNTIEVLLLRGELTTAKYLLASHRTIHIDFSHLNHFLDKVRLKGWEGDYGDLLVLADAYVFDPQKTKLKLRREKFYRDYYVPRLFAMVVMLADGYLREDSKHADVTRFFRLVSRLPMDLQMVLCHRAAGSAADTIKSQDGERGFQWVVLRFHVDGF